MFGDIVSAETFGYVQVELGARAFKAVIWRGAAFAWVGNMEDARQEELIQRYTVQHQMGSAAYGVTALEQLLVPAKKNKKKGKSKKGKPGDGWRATASPSEGGESVAAPAVKATPPKAPKAARATAVPAEVPILALEQEEVPT